MSHYAVIVITRLSLKNTRDNFLYLFLPSGAVHVCVNLGREYALMTEHFLYHPQVGSVFYQVSGKGVPETVWGDVFADARAKSTVLY